MGLMQRRTLTFTAGCALIACGCSTLQQVSAGPVVGVGKDPESTGGVAVAASTGVSFSSEATDAVGVEIGVKGKITKSSQNMALGEGLFITGRTGKALAIFRSGLHFVFERFDDTLLVGGGPYGSVEAGYIFGSREYYSPGQIYNEWRAERTILTLGPAVELDARFSRPSVLTFIGINIGIAWADEHIEPPPRATPPPLGPRLPAEPPAAPYAVPRPDDQHL
jgi:hypothetical protein